MANETQRQIYIAASISNPTGILDVGQTLSRTNHRLYRQGRNYCLKINVDPSTTKTYDVFALRDDWMLHNAWKKAYETFLNNNKEEMAALAERGSGVARWFDFRINDGIVTAAEMRPARFAIPSTGVVSPFNVNYGEFEYTQLYAEDGTSRGLDIQNSVAGVSYGILNEYDRMGNPSPAPSTALTTAAYSEVDNDLQDSAVEQLSDEGNSPPYSTTGLDYSHPFVKIGRIGTAASGVQKLSTGYFNAPCGIIVIQANTGDIANNIYELAMEMKPGNYKGVHGPTMGTAKLVAGTYEVK